MTQRKQAKLVKGFFFNNTEKQMTIGVEVRKTQIRKRRQLASFGKTHSKILLTYIPHMSPFFICGMEQGTFLMF